jgi:subtilase family serine protease
MLEFALFLAPFRRRSTARTVGPAPRRPPLRVEELESRTLLSTGPLDGFASPLTGTAAPLATSASPHSFDPAQIRRAYGSAYLGYDGSGQTIAIVDAFDDPNISGDLHTFDQRFGLPDPTLTKVKMGSPGVDGSWAGEISLDVEWAHAIAPRANLLLVEARSDSYSDLLTAVDYARKQPGVVAVSMSWGGEEFSTEGRFDSYFTTPANHLGGSSGKAGAARLRGGITFVASAGDGGSGALWPAASPNVLSVGGTTLTTDGVGNYVRESAWAPGGGGVSRFESEPIWQRGVQSRNSRTIPDVAYDANPGSGFLVYNSVPDSQGQKGWFVFGGTSAGAPQWAALVALADQGRALAGKGSLGDAQSLLYFLPSSDFRDVTTGSNGFPARAGYDLVTGLGTPRANLLVPALVKGAGSAHPAAPAAQSAQGGQATLAFEALAVGGRPESPAPETQAVDRLWQDFDVLFAPALALTNHAPRPGALNTTPAGGGDGPRADLDLLAVWAELDDRGDGGGAVLER